MKLKIWSLIDDTEGDTYDVSLHLSAEAANEAGAASTRLSAEKSTLKDTIGEITADNWQAKLNDLQDVGCNDYLHLHEHEIEIPQALANDALLAEALAALPLQERFKNAVEAIEARNAGADPWADDPQFPAEDWRNDVANGDTRSGYLDWIKAQREAIANDAPVEIGKDYRFTYPDHFTTKPDYTAHRGQTVTVIRALTADEADGPAQGESQMYRIRAADGWEGDAWDEELQPLPDDEAKILRWGWVKTATGWTHPQDTTDDPPFQTVADVMAYENNGRTRVA